MKASMPLPRRSRSRKGDLVTEIIKATFRLNGELIAYGDLLTRDLALTSSRWQVLGTIGSKQRTVAQVARQMGLTRQNVQRLANSLIADGFVERIANPDHRRAPHLRVTGRGAATLQQLRRRQADWVNRVGEQFHSEALAEALQVARAMRDCLQNMRDAEEPEKDIDT